MYRLGSGVTLVWDRVRRRHPRTMPVLRRKVQSLGVSFPMVYDSAGVLDELYRLGRRVPSSFVVDTRGEVRFFMGWANEEAERRAQIDLLERAVGALSREAR